VTRKTFPETWLFECIEKYKYNIKNIITCQFILFNSYKGESTISRKVPDTITSWIITGFSLNRANGLGLIERPTRLTVFLPFFVALNLPYSIKRGEVISLQVNVFNYLDKDLEASVTLYNEKNEFEFLTEPNLQRSQMIDKKTKKIKAKSKAGTALFFMIKPVKVGYITLKVEAISSIAGDRIEKTLMVEPEGVPVFVNKAVFIDLRKSQTFSRAVSINIPNIAIPDSTRVEVSVIGDILGPTIENLHKLL
jgi:CD109 antigen